MPALKNAKFERFALLIARGKSQIEAALAVGYSPVSASAQGSRLQHRPEVTERIHELRAVVAEQRLRNAEKVEAPSRENVILDVMETRERAKEVGNLPVRLKANEMIGKELGMFATKVDATVSSPLDTLNREALLGLLALMKGGARVVGGNVIEVDLEPDASTLMVEYDDEDDEDNPLA